MDLLREWLAPTMIREIGAMMQLGDGASDRCGPANGITYSDDGSNLRARFSKPGMVQITKFYTFDGPIKVVISDSYTYMRATIASSAASKYEVATKKRVTKDTLGGLIQILDFEIVATHLGARSERATILIYDFESVGSEGSGAFGCPRPLESLPEIVELLDQLKAMRARETQEAQPRSRLGSLTEGLPANSQFQVEGSGFDSPETSQLMFATQVPSRFSKRSLLANEGAQWEDITKSGNIKPKGTRKDNAAPDVPQKKGYLSVDAKAKAGIKRNVNTTEALLGLIAPKQTVTRVVSDQLTTKMLEIVKTPKSANKSRDISHKVKTSSTLEAANSGTGFGTPTNSSGDVQKKGQELAIGTNQFPASQLMREIKSPGVTAREPLPVLNSHSGGKNDNSNSPRQPVDYKTIGQTRKPFKRVCSRDIRISKDQQILLDRADSWLPAEPGQRGPIANVPITTLQAMNRRAEFDAQRLPGSSDCRQQQEDEVVNMMSSLTHQSSPGLEETNNGDSDSEIPVSSAEWPPSPPFEQPKDELPPDSSMETTGIPNGGNGRNVDMYNHVSLTQEIPTTPESSTSTRSKRKNPNKTSKALQSAARLSPSLMSGSADEGVKRFKCQEPECNRAYAGASGLRYHIMHVHTPTKSIGSSSRTRAPKSKSRGKASVISYICITCYNHFDTEEEYNQHQKLDSCSKPQPELVQKWADPAFDTGQLPIKTEPPLPNPSQNGEIIDLRQGNQKEGPSSVVWRLGQSTPTSPGRTYVSPYASSREAERFSGNSRSNSNSISAQLTPDQLHSKLSFHETTAPQPGRDRSKLARSEASSVDSELETTIPHALNEAKDLHVNSAPMQRFPSTATQLEEAFTQVKRTPYVNNVTAPIVPHSFPVNGNANDLSLTISTKGTECETPSPVSDPKISRTKISANDQKDSGISIDEMNNQTIVDGLVMVSQIQSDIDFQSQNSRRVSTMGKPKVSAISNISLRSTSVSTSSESSFHKDELTVTGGGSGFDLKRRSFEPTPLSPNVAKRRKHLKGSTAFKFSQDVQVAQDPSILARAYRQEFLASRKSSTSEQSDFSRRTLGTPEKNSNSTLQHFHQASVVRDGNPMSNLVTKATSTDVDVSSSAPSPLEKTSHLIEAKTESGIAGDDEDVVMTIEGEDVVDNAGFTSFKTQDNDSSNVKGVSLDQNSEIGNVVHDLGVQQCQELNLTTGFDPTNAKDDQTSTMDELAPLALSADGQQAGIESELQSAGPNLQDNAEINEEASLSGGQDAQGFLAQVNASLSSGQGSDIVSNRDFFQKSSMQAPTVVEKGEPQEQEDVLMTKVDPLTRPEIHETISPQDKPTDQSPSKSPATVFELFKIRYPEYHGDEKHFAAICKKINSLVRHDRMEHRSLWDDFIIRHIMDYPQYLQGCALNAEDPLPYERFYRNEIEDAKFTKRIVTPKNLKEILGIGGQENVAVLPHQRWPQQPQSVNLTNAAPMPSLNCPRKPASVAASTPQPPLPHATVDLTEDSDDSKLVECVEPVRSAHKTPRPLPWVKSSQEGAFSPSQRGDIHVEISASPRTLSTPLGHLLRSSTPLKATRLADLGSKGGGVISSPLPRTSTRHRVLPSSTTTRGTADNESVLQKASAVSRSSTIDRPQANGTKDTPIPQANAKTTDSKPRENDKPHESWKDKDNPFKQFAKAYTSIRPANGNSFAKPTSSKTATNSHNPKEHSRTTKTEIRSTPKFQDWYL